MTMDRTSPYGSEAGVVAAQAWVEAAKAANGKEQLMSSLSTEQRSEMLRLMEEVMQAIEPSRAALDGPFLIFEVPATTLEKVEEVARLVESKGHHLTINRLSLQVVRGSEADDA